MKYFVYMLICDGGSYYIGITNDLARRWAAHLAGKGAKYTKSHKPVKLVYQEELSDHGSALRREYELKKLTHQEKIALLAPSSK